MAVSYSIDTGKILQAAGVNNTTIMSLAASGIKLLLVKNSLKFVKDGEVVASTKMLPMVASKIVKDGDAGNYSVAIKNAVALAFLNAKGAGPITVTKGSAPAGGAMSKLHQQLEDVVSETEAPKPTVPEPEKSKPGIVAGPKAAGKFGVYSGSLSAGKEVPLVAATKLYQPVAGTSGGSRYFVVAARDDLKIAARYKAGKLSVRIEGDIITHRIAIEGCGVSGGGGFDKGYVSMHLDVSDSTLAAKTLGAVLLGLGVEFETAMPKMSVIAGEGK